MADLVQQNPVVPLDIQGIAMRKAALLEADQRQRDRAIEEQTAAEQRRILGEVAKTPLIQDPQTGAWVPDRDALMQKFGGMIPEPLRKILDESDTHIANVHKAQEASLSDGARRVIAAGNDPDVWNQNLDYWEKNHVLSAAEAKHYRSMTDPQQIATVAAQLAGQQPEGTKVVGNALVGERSGRVVYQQPEAQPKPDVPVIRVNPATGKMEQMGTAPAGAHFVQQPQASSGAGGAAKPNLSEGAIRRAGAAYRILGPQSIPTRIGEPDRVAIMNEADKQAGSLGESPVQTVQRQIMLQGDKAALSLIEKQLGSTVAAESKALKQIDLIQRISPTVPRTDWPVINGAVQALKIQTGNTPATLLSNAIVTFASEYGKIVEGSTGSAAGASVSAQEAGKRLITAAMSGKTLDSVVAQMKQEMSYAKEGWGAASDYVLGRMGGGEFGARQESAPAASTAPAGLPTKPPPDQSGNWKWNGTDWVKR